MSPGEIIAAFEAGNPGSERLERLRARTEDLCADGVWGSLLASLCRLDGPGIDGFLRRVAPGVAPAASPRGLDGIVGVVERLRDGSLRCRVEAADEPYEAMVLPQLHRAQVRRRLGLASDAWSEEAEAEGRRIHAARERPFVLAPAGPDAESGAAHIVAALVANAARAEAARLRSEDLRVRRERAQLDRIG